MQTLFISDLHLAEERPKKSALFLRFINELDNSVDALYILGDLFEFWHGDDDDSKGYKEILDALKSLSVSGVKLYAMRGNRDFLLGEKFEQLSGATLLDDPCVIDLYGTKTLLMHGDLLCTDDVAYQKFRKITNNKILQRLFVLLPLSIRKKIASRVRTHSKEGVKEKSPDIMDVTQATVEDYMNEYKIGELIHGHTHRRNTHHFKLNGKDAKRIVLGDWYGEDSVLVCEQDRQELLRINDYLREH